MRIGITGKLFAILHDLYARPCDHELGWPSEL